MNIKHSYYKGYTVEVVTSDGRYEGEYSTVKNDGVVSFYNGQMQARLVPKFGPEIDLDGDVVLGHNFKVILRVYNCWKLTSGPADLWKTS